jgi:hypothetical protein
MGAIAQFDWNALIQQEDGILVMVLAMCATILIISVTAVIAIEWRRIQVAKINARLKELMIQRGYSVEEISTVIGARGPKPRRVRPSAGRSSPCTS